VAEHLAQREKACVTAMFPHSARPATPTLRGLFFGTGESVQTPQPVFEYLGLV
jgi:hypothetical protein